MSRISADALLRVVPGLEVQGLTVVEGPAGSGKTAELVRRAVDAAASGDVLVVCATRAAAQDFARRADALSHAGSESLHIRCVTPWELAVEVLAEVDDRRPLFSFEALDMPADLARLAIRAERLDQMLLFFEKSWSELADWNPAWLVTHEERDLQAAIEAWQERMHARLASRVVPDAVAVLKEGGQVCGKVCCPTVLVDDYPLLSRAEQVLAVLCCTGEFVVASDGGHACGVVSDHAYPDGIEELVLQNPGARRLVLGPEMSDATVAVDGERPQDAYERDRVRFEFLDGASGWQVLGEGLVQGYGLAAEEFDAVAERVGGWLEQGMKPEDILVVAVHPTWRANVKIALESNLGIRAEILPEVDLGNPGGTGYVPRVRALSLLRLAADPDDAAARNAWGKDLPKELLCGCKGRELLDVVAVHVVGQTTAVHLADYLERVCAPADGRDASGLIKNLERNMWSPGFCTEGAVRICSLEQAWGLRPRACHVAGCMEGFLPSKDVFKTTLVPANVRERILRTQVASLEALKDGCEDFSCSATREIPYGLSEKLGLEPSRILVRETGRVAVLRPTRL